jgi:hypothetical protein
MIVARIAIAAALATGVGSSAAAQAPRCRVDSTAEWARAQRQWLAESSTGWSDSTFRALLTQGAGLDATGPVPLQLGYELAALPNTTSGATPNDSAAVGRLRALASQRGSQWPTRSVVGAAGVRAVWLLAARDSALMPTVLHRLMEAGPDESSPADVATLEDRLRVRAGRKQLYGTQMHVVNGSVEPYPMEDPEHVDLRRDGAQLPPIAVSRCLARSARR